MGLAAVLTTSERSLNVNDIVEAVQAGMEGLHGRRS